MLGDCSLCIMVNHHFSPPFGRIFLELFPSIENANPRLTVSYPPWSLNNPLIRPYFLGGGHGGYHDFFQKPEMVVSNICCDSFRLICFKWGEFHQLTKDAFVWFYVSVNVNVSGKILKFEATKLLNSKSIILIEIELLLIQNSSAIHGSQRRILRCSPLRKAFWQRLYRS